MKLHITLGATLVAGVSIAQGIGPTPYLQTSDSPWFSLVGNSDFFLEDFEDGLLNTPGVSASAGNPIGPSGNTDSVDGDDGTVDGSGVAGHSFFNPSGISGITFTFDEATLGALPTAAGIVWTDGLATINFEAFDENGNSLGALQGNHATGGFGGQTDEDRFYGWEYSGGISAIYINNTSGGIEVDHLQYGAIPEPATLSLLALGALALRKKKQKQLND